ncbi:hypothetical protein BTN82_21335 [Pseudomonas chlororaphis]|uniref:Uncharacterized protein n=1 Tax=Pseudomonas chlororaphis TaxID=587753 RepID=A0A1Q8EL41_9PSED|nr:hypothetical protein BTN82_21335 [Pseudomonas chlororaphis]
MVTALSERIRSSLGGFGAVRVDAYQKCFSAWVFCRSELVRDRRDAKVQDDHVMLHREQARSYKGHYGRSRLA